MIPKSEDTFSMRSSHVVLYHVDVAFARGIVRFVDELVARLRRASATGELTVRMDSGFWSAKLIARLRALGVRYSITVRQTKTVRAAIAPSVRTTGSTSTTPATASRRWPRSPTATTASSSDESATSAS
jgi:hypothetical protein